MHVRSVEGEERVTPLELFFDLVFGFTLTQVTGFLAANESGEGLLRGVLLFAALWWAWAAYAWLTNTLDPEEGAVRLAVFASTGAMLIVALATPTAFGTDALVFGIAYFIVRVVVGPAQIGLWVAALSIEFLGTQLGRGRGWRLSPAHFVERHGLIII